MTVSMTVDGYGSITFDGAASIASATSTTAAVTLDGAGTISPSDSTPNLVIGDWTCTPHVGIAYEVRSLHRVLSACAADSGELAAVQTYECRKVTTSRRDASVQTTAAKITVVGAWNAATASSGEISIEVSLTFAGTTEDIDESTVAIRACN